MAYAWRCGLHPFINLLSNFHGEVQIRKLSGILCRRWLGESLLHSRSRQAELTCCIVRKSLDRKVLLVDRQIL